MEESEDSSDDSAAVTVEQENLSTFISDMSEKFPRVLSDSDNLSDITLVMSKGGPGSTFRLSSDPVGQEIARLRRYVR